MATFTLQPGSTGAALGGQPPAAPAPNPHSAPPGSDLVERSLTAVQLAGCGCDPEVLAGLSDQDLATMARVLAPLCARMADDDELAKIQTLASSRQFAESARNARTDPAELVSVFVAARRRDPKLTAEGFTGMKGLAKTPASEDLRKTCEQSKAAQFLMKHSESIRREGHDPQDLLDAFYAAQRKDPYLTAKRHFGRA